MTAIYFHESDASRFSDVAYEGFTIVKEYFSGDKQDLVSIWGHIHVAEVNKPVLLKDGNVGWFVGDHKYLPDIRAGHSAVTIGEHVYSIPTWIENPLFGKEVIVDETLPIVEMPRMIEGEPELFTELRVTVDTAALDADEQARIEAIVPERVTRAQFLAALHVTGYLQAVKTAISASGDPLLDIWFNESLHFYSANETIKQLATALGISCEQLDDIYRRAAKVKL